MHFIKFFIKATDRMIHWRITAEAFASAKAQALHKAKEKGKWESS